MGIGKAVCVVNLCVHIFICIHIWICMYVTYVYTDHSLLVVHRLISGPRSSAAWGLVRDSNQDHPPKRYALQMGGIFAPSLETPKASRLGVAKHQGHLTWTPNSRAFFWQAHPRHEPPIYGSSHLFLT